MKKGLIVLGIGLIAGSLISLLINKKEIKKNKNKVYVKNSSSDNLICATSQNDQHIENENLEDIKSSVIETMYTRHKEASDIMKESIDIICNRTQVLGDEHDDLEKISNELDELLRED